MVLPVEKLQMCLGFEAGITGEETAQSCKSSNCERIIYAQHIEREGKRFFQEICALDLEGIVAKRIMGIYKDDGNSWLKIKNRSYSQAEGRHALLTKNKKS